MLEKAVEILRSFFIQVVLAFLEIILAKQVSQPRHLGK